MASLADAVLCVDDDFDLDDAELARELEELRSKRVESRPGTAASRCVVEETPASKPQPATAPAPSKSLADQIGQLDPESELAAMERELEAQLQAFRKEQASPTAAAQPPTLQSTTASMKVEQPSGEGAAERAVTPVEGGDPVEAEVPSELVDLRAEVSLMESAFPDKQESGQGTGKASKQEKKQVRQSHREQDRKEAPVDDVNLLKDDLDQVEIRLKALKQRQELHFSNPLVATAPSGNKRLDELRAQNAHLRQKLADASVKKTKWQLDASLFGYKIDQAPTDAQVDVSQE